MRINHPRPELGRQRTLGVEFIDGVATVESLHPERELALLQHGYTIEANPEVEAPYHAGLGEAIVDLTSLTVPQLRDIAEADGVDLSAKARKPEIIEILSRTSEPIPGATQNEDGSWTIEGVPLTDEPELVGPFGAFQRPDGTQVGDGTSLVELDAADETSDFED